MEKLKLFSREQVGNAPLTGRQYSRPDSLSLVSRQSVLAFLLVLLTTVFGVGNVWGEEVTITFADLNLTNQKQYSDPFNIDANVTITFGGGANDGKYYTTGAGIRTYGGGTITIDAGSYTISEAAFTWDGSYKPGADNANPKGYSTTTGKWTGNASSFVLTRPSGSGHWRLKSVTVTYSGGDQPTPSAEPESNSIDVDAAGGNGTINVTYSNFEVAASAVLFYDQTGESVVDAPSWMTAETDEENNNIQYSVQANSGEARTAYLKVYAINDDSDELYSSLITISQAEYVAPFDGLKLTFDVSANPGGWPTTNSTTTTDYTYTLNEVDYTFALNNVKCNSGYLMLTATAKLGLPAISGYKLVKVEAKNSGGCSTSTKVKVSSDVNGENVVSGGSEQTWTTQSSTYTYTLTGTEENTMYYLYVTNKNCQITELVLYYVEAEAAAVATPSISGEDNFLNSTEVSMTCATEGTAIYYTTTESAKETPATSGYWTAYDSENKPSFNATTTVWAAAKKDAAWSAVAEKTFTKATIMTVAQARAAIDAGGDLSNKFVAGIISQIDSYNSTYNSITYWISDDGTTTNQLQVYSGLAGVVKSAFASKDDLAVGDDVTVKGTLKKFNSTYEFDYNNTIVIYKTTAQLAWSASSYNASLEGENTFPTLTNTNDVTVTYSSSDPEKAEINETTGAITLKAVGTVTITATFAGNETYKANAVSYEMSIASSLVTLTYNVDGGEAIDPVNVSALPNPLPTTTKAGKNFGGWFTDPEKEVAAVPGAAISENTTLYAKWLDPYTVAEAKTVIDATPAGTENQYVAGIISQIDSYNGTYKSITYWISADGTTTNQLQVYGGLIGNAATALKKDYFTQEEDLKLGDQVVVKGTLKKYNSTYEFDKNNTIYSFNRPAPKYTVRLWNTAEGWSTVNAHVWNNDGNVTEWPGEATTFKAGWNEFEVEEGNSLLFCKADGSAQTVDIANVIADACYVLTGTADGLGHLEVALDTECAARFYVAGNTELTGESWNAAGARLVNGAITFTNVPAGDHQFKVTNGSWNWERGYLAFDSENSNVTNWGDNNVGFTTKSAKDITITYDEANNKITVQAEDYVAPAEPEYRAVVVAYGDKYYAMTTNFDDGGFTPLAVKVDANGNVLVQTEAERNSILWKYAAGTETATFQDANNQYLAKGSGNTGLALASTAAEWTWNSDGGYYYVSSDRTFLYQSENNIFKNYATSNASATGYSDLPVFYEAAKVIVSNTATLKFFAPVAWENVIVRKWEGGEVDHQMTAVEEGSRWFQCEIEKGVPFLVYNGSWDGLNQTEDIAAIDADKCFAWSGVSANGKYNVAEITSCEMSYYIAGDEVLTGVAEWGHKALAANNTVAFSEVAADTYHFKITNGSWAWNLGAAYLDETACQNVTIEETDANGNVVFTIDNPSDITIAYDPATEKISVVATAVTPKEYYTKVTSTADLTAGYYLIVSEDNLLEEHVALNGELSTLDATNNVIDVEIVTGKGIEVTDATNAAAFFIDPEIGTIKSASGLFIGRTGNSNGLNQSENIYAYENAFSFDEDGNADIMIGSLKLRYNSASNQNRFRYFTSAQQTIQLYKKAEAAKASPELAFAQSEVQGLKGNVIASNLTNEHNVPVTYVSSATTYASVDEEGNVTLKKAGNVTIYAVTAGDETYRESYAKYTITINDFGSYTRPVTPDNYGTICLPKAGVMTGATLFEIGSYENNIIYVDEVNGGAMEAGKPYIFQATSDQLNVAYTSNVEVAAGENNGLHGFYNLTNENAQFNIPADEGNYILYQNRYWLVSGRAAYIANNRAYIRVSEINSVAPAPGRRRVAMNVNGEQTATGINELNAAEAPVKMIMNGQLYILRGEKLYDATGRLVK